MIIVPLISFSNARLKVELGASSAVLDSSCCNILGHKHRASVGFDQQFNFCADVSGSNMRPLFTIGDPVFFFFLLLILDCDLKRDKLPSALGRH